MIDPLNTGKLAKTALEVKATVGSAAVMDAALTNLASVKELDRTNEGRNRGAAEWENPRPDEHDRSGVRCSHRRIIDAYPNALTSFGNWGSSRPRTQWANAYVDVRDLLVE